MSKATHKQKLAHANICQRYWHDPVAVQQLRDANSPFPGLLGWIFGEKTPDDVKADLGRLRTLMRCMKRGES